MNDADYYAPGTYRDPAAPWNQDDYEDECIEYQVETFRERLTDDPDTWICEGICEQAGEKEQDMYKRIINNLQRGYRIPEDNSLLGKYVRVLVETYATPTDQEAYEAVTEKKSNDAADRADYYCERDR